MEEWKLQLSCSFKTCYVIHKTCSFSLQLALKAIYFPNKYCSACGLEIPKHFLIQMSVLNG